MAQERPTFHEAWYRVAELRPRLHFTVQVYRQFYRGQHWYVLENPANNRFSRINRDTYHFIALLDGRRTVDEAWRLAADSLGDRAPTQGEAIRVLGQLHTSNLLYAELAPDTESLFKRYQTRRHRQIQAFMTNLLFIKIPLINPNRFLDRWVGLVGWLYSWIGLIMWLGGVSVGLYFVISNFTELMKQSRDVLAPDNLIYLYLSMVAVKVVHEFSHAFCCKKFGKANESGGHVNAMGIMFLVFMPLPFVDASSAWTFKRKGQRALVGMAGVMFELFVASIAVVVWANTSTGALHIIAYNIIFVASVSTLVFNGNPLLRFDAYYVLSDLIEIPNLRQRSWQYYYYLVKRYVWGLKDAMNPGYGAGEKVWLGFYGIASMIYRVFICVRILLFLNDRLPDELFILVPIFALSALFMWVVVPLGKFVRYLLTGPELNRNRGRAVATTLAVVALLVAGLGFLKVPDHVRIEGIVEPVKLAIVHAETDGFIQTFIPSGQRVAAGRDVIVRCENRQLEAAERMLEAELAALEVQLRSANASDMAAYQILREKNDAMKAKLARLQNRLRHLAIKPALSGTWVSPAIDTKKGMYVRRGQTLGLVADLDEVRIRATAGQETQGLLVGEADKTAQNLEMRARGRPDVLVTGSIQQIFPAGSEVLPSQALGYQVGGSMSTALEDPRGIRSAEKFIEIRIRPDTAAADGSEEAARLLSGQRVVVRVQVPSKPLMHQWYRYFRQLFQRRFQV